MGDEEREDILSAEQKPLSVKEFNKVLIKFNPETDIWKFTYKKDNYEDLTDEKPSPSTIIIIYDFDSENILNKIYNFLYSFYNIPKKTILQQSIKFFFKEVTVDFEELKIVLKSFIEIFKKIYSSGSEHNYSNNYKLTFKKRFGDDIKIYLGYGTSLEYLSNKIDATYKILNSIYHLTFTNMKPLYYELVDYHQKYGGAKRRKTTRRRLKKKKRAVTKRRTQKKQKTKF